MDDRFRNRGSLSAAVRAAHVVVAPEAIERALDRRLRKARALIGNGRCGATALSAGTTIGTELYHQSASIPNGPSLTGASIGTIFQLGTHHAVLFSFGHALAGGDRFSAYGSYEIHT